MGIVHHRVKKVGQNRHVKKSKEMSSNDDFIASPRTGFGKSHIVTTTLSYTYFDFMYRQLEKIGNKKKEKGMR